MAVHYAEAVLPVDMPLLRRQAIPPGRFRIVLGNALARGIHLAQLELRIGIAQRGLFFERFQATPDETDADEQYQPDSAYQHGFNLPWRLAKPLFNTGRVHVKWFSEDTRAAWLYPFPRPGTPLEQIDSLDPVHMLDERL
jgi:hypothetical protein